MNEKSLTISGETIRNLNILMGEKKFYKDEKRIYPGAPAEEIRVELETRINRLTDNLIKNIKSNPKKSFVLNEFKLTLNNCYDYDTEEREMICSYLERIMDILKMDGSGGMLNNFMYGFDP